MSGDGPLTISGSVDVNGAGGGAGGLITFNACDIDITEQADDVLSAERNLAHGHTRFFGHTGPWLAQQRINAPQAFGQDPQIVANRKALGLSTADGSADAAQFFVALSSHQ